jgi:16S rRNA (cytidine1402-2'-O)-methyltransferase
LCGRARRATIVAMSDRDRKAAGAERGGGALFVVATPIGNPDDISLRAIKILGAVDLVACEDTRRTGQLLAAHGIKRPMVSYFEHNEERRAPELIERLLRGEQIALVSDAGTPGVSDPGYRLVRAALEAGVRVSAVPGPSAVVAALAIAGLPTDRFAFEGFLPARAGARRKHLAALAHEERTMVFFEAARRLGATLADLSDSLGAEREAAIVREITKTWEETIRGTLGELAARFASEQALGEITIVVAGAPEGQTPIRTAELSLDDLLDKGLSLKQSSAIMAHLTGRSARDIYQEALRTRGGERDE